jgi:subtilisin family serine protease
MGFAKKLLLSSVVVLLVSVIWVLLLEGLGPDILEPEAVKPGPQRFVMWNKKAFEKKPGQMSTMNVTVLSAMGAKDIQPMETINGFTFEAEQGAKVFDLSQQSDWIVQEELTHGILAGFKPQAPFCFKCDGGFTPMSCATPSPTPTPGPTPGPGPQPTPTPTPVPSPTPVEPDKSWGRKRVNAAQAMALVDTSNVKICVIDTGIDMSHPNKGNVIGSIGYAGAVQDRQGHGTHTAGTVAGTGGVGVSRAKLLICKGLSDSGSGSSSQLAQCLNWCGQQGAQIVSNSWGSTQSDSLINQAIAGLTQRGIYVFVANGNDGRGVNWPAKLSGSNALVYAVAASDSGDRITSFSSRGPETKVISPGAAIVSNWIGGGTRSLDGTSMATPHAAAICAYGIAKGLKPCIKFSGVVGGYNFGDALLTAQ